MGYKEDVICNNYMGTRAANYLSLDPNFAFVEDMEHPGTPFQEDSIGYFLFRRRLE